MQKQPTEDPQLQVRPLLQKKNGALNLKIIRKGFFIMLEYLKKESNRTYTENGAVTNATSCSDCVDLFATVGALRNAGEDRINGQFDERNRH